ncbi:hypothetical protein DVA67_018615 [Solirubrobacter sp. CPCC 204708]|uniref:Uncharacterized protein n=1 Tax=Solirubrobacter deserti TaxID=2282478 RepID=A0ABT4RM90_9ACTN|nr:hypothetical protein [Solirubrobacter deserti]MBE2318001.1 hypothetical protein [Solirubrobacter deserti]MDA0139680.1 hypothetical protein [Solirubrobacter deserti]
MAAATLAGLVAAPAHASEALHLDARGPDVASAPLAAGATYYARVSGTVSIWNLAQWSQPGDVCGSAESGPMYPSSGVTNGPVGFDAETIFAVPPGVPFENFRCVSAQIPMHVTTQTHGGFHIGVDGQFTHAEPIGGPFAVPRADHTYTYRLTGTGRPAVFRFEDNPTSDNYGRFRITILSEAECQAENCIGAATAPPPPVLPTAPSSPTTPATTTPQAAVRNATGLLSVSTTRRCASRPYVRLRLRAPKGVTLRSAVIKYGKRTIRLSRAKLKRSIYLRSVSRNTFTVRITVTTTRGQTLKASRTFKRCASRAR